MESGKDKYSRKWRVESRKKEQRQRTRKKIEEQISDVRCQISGKTRARQLAACSEQWAVRSSRKWKVASGKEKIKDKR